MIPPLFPTQTDKRLEQNEDFSTRLCLSSLFPENAVNLNRLVRSQRNRMYVRRVSYDGEVVFCTHCTVWVRRAESFHKFRKASERARHQSFNCASSAFPYTLGRFVLEKNLVVMWAVTRVLFTYTVEICASNTPLWVFDIHTHLVATPNAIVFFWACALAPISWVEVLERT